MSKIYPIIVLFTYIAMVYMWIMAIIKKDYRSHYLLYAIGVSVGFMLNIIAAIINSNMVDVAVYLSAIFLLLIICISISVHCKNKEKEEITDIRETIISSPIYKAVIDEYNQNNYGVLYVCSDGVAFSHYLSDEISFPVYAYSNHTSNDIDFGCDINPYEHLEDFNMSSYAIAKQRAQKWKQENASTTGISLIPEPIFSITYSTFGYADMGEKEISALTELIAEKLNLDRKYFTKTFGVNKQPEKQDLGFYSLIVIGAVYRKGAVLPKQELKSW